MNHHAIAFIVGIAFLFDACTSNYGTLTINTGEKKKVNPILYGWHYEEIGMIGEGGLYAEMVRNRGLEEANPPPGLEVRNGLYVNVPDPTAPLKKVYSIDPLTGWGVLPEKGEHIRLQRVREYPLNDKNPHSLRVDVAELPAGIICGVFNSGFFGMNLKKGLEYNLSFYARGENNTGPLTVRLTDSLGSELSTSFTIPSLGKSWQKYTASLTASANITNGILLFSPGSTGTLWLDVVSLFPSDTWDNGKSVFRADIMQNLLDYAPDFIRFPGGCLVHGVNVETMYHWKETVGDIAERPGGWTKWSPNYRTDGLGYHEFYELCEYLGADAMYVTPSGLVCTGWVFRDGNSDNYFQPEVNVQDYIQDCLDAIQYAIGPTDSKWGSMRARNGHPGPFPLKYVEIGNEDFGPRYYENYDAFYHAIKKEYPGIKIIANSIIGRSEDRDRKRERLVQFKDISTVEIFDEHYYKDIPWLIRNYYKFDAYQRPGPDMMIGELGIAAKHPLDVLGEAVFMTMVERNADLNPICADRPLMRNWTYVEGRGNPLYYHTNNLSWKTMNYYQSKLFRDNTQDVWFESVYKPEGNSLVLSEETLFSSAGKDTRSGNLLLKVVNLTDSMRRVRIEIDGWETRGRSVINTLTARMDQRNTPDNPFNVIPDTSVMNMKFPCDYTFKPRSLTIFIIQPIQ